MPNGFLPTSSLLAITAGAVNGFSPVFQKYATNIMDIPIPQNPIFVLGISLMIVGGTILFFALSRGKASVMFVLFGSVTQFVTLISCRVITDYLPGVQTEMITGTKVIGIGLIVGAVYLLGSVGVEKE